MWLTSPESGASEVVRARLLQAILERGLSTPLRVVSVAPPQLPHLFDARAALLGTIEATLSTDDARTILRSWLGSDSAALPTIDPGTLDSLRDRAVAVAAEKLPTLDGGDARLVGSLIERTNEYYRLKSHHEIQNAIQGRSSWRRALYQAFSDGAALLEVSHRLNEDDVPWIVEDGIACGADRYVSAAYRLRDQFPMLSPSRVALDDLLSRYEERVATLEADRASHIAAFHEMARKYPPLPSPPPPRALRDVIAQLNSPTADPRAQLDWFGALCFAPDALGGNGVEGTFEELDAASRQFVLSRAAQLLQELTPTEIPERRGSFSTRILLDAGTYAALVLRDGAVRRDATLMRKWLPSLLFDLRGDAVDALRLLHQELPDLVRDAVVEVVRRDVGQDDKYMLTARRLPEVAWNARLISDCLDVVRDGSQPAMARQELLRCIAENAGSAWHAVGAALLTLLDSSVLGDVAVECLGRGDPRAAVPLLVERVKDKAKLELLRPFLEGFGHREGGRVAALDIASVERLADLLFRVLRGEREQLGPHRVGLVDEALDLRSRLCERLLFSRESGAEDAIARLAAYQPTLRKARDRFLAGRRVEGVLRELEDTWIPGTGVVVRTFETETFRFLRNERDLSMVLVEVLRTIEQSIGHDLDLLYTAPDAAGGAPRRPRELALQAYVRRRLEDLLPRYCDAVNVEIIREPQAMWRRRYDLMVMARLATRGMGTVVIELKWAHDRRVRRSMMEQLGDKYLQAENRACGIYLVGLTSGSVASSRLKTDLEGQRREYLARLPGLSIELVFLPCQWVDPEPASGTA